MASLSSARYEAPIDRLPEVISRTAPTPGRLLVESRPAGRSSVFSLTQPDAVLKVFAAAEELLGATGDAVVLRLTYGERTA